MTGRQRAPKVKRTFPRGNTMLGARQLRKKILRRSCSFISTLSGKRLRQIGKLKTRLCSPQRRNRSYRRGPSGQGRGDRPREPGARGGGRGPEGEGRSDYPLEPRTRGRKRGPTGEG